MGERPASFIPDSGAPKSFIPDAPAAPDVRKRPLLMGTSDAGIAQQLPNTPDAVQQVRAAQAPLENAAVALGASALGGTVAAGTSMMQNPVVQGVGKAVLAGGAYQAGRALGVPSEVLNGLMLLAGAKEGMAGILKGRGAPNVPAESPNAGGTLVPRQEPTLNEVVGNALDALRAPNKPRMVTTPPQPSLPPGYVPRSTAPAPVASPSGMASMQAAAPTPEPAPAAPAAAPTRPYFLKPEAETPTPTPAAPQPDLPQAWQQFTKPASFPPKEIEGSGLAAAFLQELTKRGMQASEAIPMVLRNKALDAATRSQLVTALEKVARAQAGVLQ